MVRRMISPRRSNLARVTAFATTNESNGFEATITCAPGTTIGNNDRAHAKKNRSSSPRSSRVRTVNRGNGDLLFPSNEGGIRHTPPLPSRSLFCSCSLYSTRPYGGSVTTPSMLFVCAVANHSKQSPWISVALPKRNALRCAFNLDVRMPVGSRSANVACASSRTR